MSRAPYQDYARIGNTKMKTANGKPITWTPKLLPLMDELLTLARDISHMSIEFDETSIRDMQQRMAEIFAELDEMGDLAP